MKLEELYEMQKSLDARIIKEKGLEGKDLLPNTVLALQVEIGECANEFRGFKHWSNDRKPRIEQKECPACKGNSKVTGTLFDGRSEWVDVSIECNLCGGDGYVGPENPLLEEYVDGLHFVLSIGRQIEFDVLEYDHDDMTKELTGIVEAFNHSFNWASLVLFNMGQPLPNRKVAKKCYYRLLDVFLSLGKMLGFTWEQIAAAYVAKNQVNHDRQANGY